MQYNFTLKPSPVSRPLSDAFFGNGPDREIGFTTQSMTVNGQPFFGVSGELHFARLAPEDWLDRLSKMKAGGINIASTYIFWIHHEETPGEFDFTGRRNLHAFLDCCKEVGIYVILRVGPFCHGEARNGGLPDWLYGMPFEVRSLNDGFMHYTQRFINEIGKQAEGFLFKDGGPVIGVQLENEYMHSAAIWEQTRATTREYANSSNDGDAYLLRIKALCKEAGLITPFYTCTAWGGAATPWQEALPLWGGYPYAPWLVDAEHPEHPATEEFLYRDCRDPEGARYHSYNPIYDPREMPFACCEMGPSMQTSYTYRFIADPRAADGLSNIKIGSGCNFVGYYMYAGGTNPKGHVFPFLHEEWCPKLSYDYQAPIGEFGQLRENWKRLRVLHATLRNFESRLCHLTPVLPNVLCADPKDTETLRCAVRSDGDKGFLFLNNFQDHVETKPLSNMSVSLRSTSGEINFPPLSIASGESCILPFGLNVLGSPLLYATIQPIHWIKDGDSLTVFAMRPDGMDAEIKFEGRDVLSLEDGTRVSIFLADGTLKLITLSHAQANSLCIHEGHAYLSDNGTIYPREGKVCIESNERDVAYTIDGERHHITFPDYEGTVQAVEACANRWILTLPTLPMLSDLPDVLIKIDYDGDIAQLFTPLGELVSDHFHNGQVWEVSLQKLLEKAGTDRQFTLMITPRKEGTIVSRDAMAAITETVARQVAKLNGLQTCPVYRGWI